MYLHEKEVAPGPEDVQRVGEQGTRRELKLRPISRLPGSFATPPTRTREVVTLWYRAPELLLGERVYGTATDAEQGCIFAELPAKEPLFQGKNEADQTEKIFALLGAPDERVWPGHATLPNARKAAVYSSTSRTTGSPRSREERERRGADDQRRGVRPPQQTPRVRPGAARAGARRARPRVVRGVPAGEGPEALPTFPSKAAGGRLGRGGETRRRGSRRRARRGGGRGGGRAAGSSPSFERRDEVFKQPDDARRKTQLCVFD